MIDFDISRIKWGAAAVGVALFLCGLGIGLLL